MAYSAAARKPAPVPPRTSARPAPKVAAVLYARVSSKDQEKEGFSIPAQQKLLRGYAEERGFAIKEEFTDIETAKKAGRTSFSKMLAWLRRNSKCKVILVEKTDRLYRNLKDWVELDGMDLEIHLVKEGVVLSEESRSSEKFIHGIKVLMAKNYIDNLSEEVKKGMLEKAEQGIWPGPAPLGYLNVARPDGKRIVDVDPEYAPVIKRIFEMYATGTYTLKQLAAYCKDNGVVSRKAKKPLQIANIHLFLHNPLYKGEYVWNGKWYTGSHPALVTAETWDRVQDIMAGRGTTHPAVQKHQFAFNGLIHCGVCADLGERRLLVGEIQRKKYIYYHCNGCQRAERKPPFIREEVLSEAFTRHLKRLHLDGVVLTFLKDALRDSHADEQRFHHAAIERLTKQYAALQRKLDVIYEDRLEGRLTVERYEEKANGFREEMAHARTELARHENADRAYTEEGIALLELAGMALELWESQDAPERRRLLDFLCLNTEFRDGGLSVKWKKPFDALAESIDAAKTKGAAIDESSDAHQVWLRIVMRSRTGQGQDSPLTLRVVRRLPPKNSPSSKKKKEKKEVVGVLRRAVEMQRRLREPGVGNRAGLARTLGVSRAHISQSMAVLDVPGRLMDTLVRAEKSGKPVTVGAWRKVKGLPEEAAMGKLREMGYP